MGDASAKPVERLPLTTATYPAGGPYSPLAALSVTDQPVTVQSPGVATLPLRPCIQQTAR